MNGTLIVAVASATNVLPVQPTRFHPARSRTVRVVPGSTISARAKRPSPRAERTMTSTRPDASSGGTATRSTPSDAAIGVTSVSVPSMARKTTVGSRKP